MKSYWYSAKCIFRHLATEQRRQMYEERIVLLKANNFDDAINQAEKEGKKYCKDLGNCEYAGFIDVFELTEEKITEKSEIFSAMQSSELSSEDYLKRFYPDKLEDCENIGLSHRWYNKSNKIYACYHCDVFREKN
jgi:hypothetical protein